METHLEELAECLRATVSAKPIPALSQSLVVAISVGLAISTDYPKQDVEEIVHHADMALYAAKSRGRNCVRVANPDTQPTPATVLMS